MNSECQTRQERIDLQLGRAGWTAGSRRVVEEFLVETASVLHEPIGSYRTRNEFVDYALLDRLGRPLAIVEARRSSRDPLIFCLRGSSEISWVAVRSFACIPAMFFGPFGYREALRPMTSLLEAAILE